MARSHAIWLVTYDGFGKELPEAAFTVKHELVTYLRQYEEKFGGFEHLSLYRMSDGTRWHHEEDNSNWRQEPECVQLNLYSVMA